MKGKYLYCPQCGNLARTGYYSNIIGCIHCAVVLRISEETTVGQDLKQKSKEESCE